MADSFLTARAEKEIAAARAGVAADGADTVLILISDDSDFLPLLKSTQARDFRNNLGS
jgi:hypothetical protein